MERLDDAGPVAFKGVRDIVTEVDHASEALIRGDLAERFPGDGFYGEECGRDATVTPRTWVCDPIDGTVNYANGIPFFCVSLALVERGAPWPAWCTTRSAARRTRRPRTGRRPWTAGRSACRRRSGSWTW